jgi:hypothetical protein
MVLRLCLLFGIWGTPMLISALTWREAGGVLSIALTLAATVTAAVAVAQRQRVAANSLNLWDEAALMLALASLLRLVAGATTM